MRWWIVVGVVMGCSSSGSVGNDAGEQATSSYDCSGAPQKDLATRDDAEKACAELRRTRQFCQVCVQTADENGNVLAYSASPNAEPCGCPQPKVEQKCRACSTTGIPGVSLCVSAPSCTFASGVGGTFTYQTIVTDAAPALHTTETGPGCAVCASWSSDPMSFVSYTIGGNGVRYCMCDTGCCAPQPEKTITLERGTKSGTIEWPGKQWDGPSDTGQPLGAPFPPGSYAVDVTFAGAKEGTVKVSLPITVQ